MPRKYYHIMEFGVDKAYRRKGVATALIEYCKKDALDKGVQEVYRVVCLKRIDKR